MAEPDGALLGHDCPLGRYPAPVVPIIRSGDSLCAVYAAQTGNNVVALAKGASFVPHEPALDDPLAGFRPACDRLFGFSERVIEKYAIADEDAFFSALLRSHRIPPADIFLRLSLAKATTSSELLREALGACLAHIRARRPASVASWVSQQLADLAADPRLDAAASILSPVNEPARLFRPPLSLQILLAFGAGLVAGPLLGKGAEPLGEIGGWVIQFVKIAAIPLLFLIIVRAILATNIRWRSALRLMLLAGANGLVAVLIGFAVSLVSRAGLELSGRWATAAPADQRGFVWSVVIGTTIVAAVTLGLSLRSLRLAPAGSPRVDRAEAWIHKLLHLLERVLSWVFKVIPVVVFCVVANAVGEYGYAPLKGLAAYLGAGLLALALHVALIYNVWLLVVRMPIRRFWREASEPVAYAAGTNSSLATLPITLRALERLGVSRSASALGACIGTSINNDGIVVYCAMAVLFVAQASGVHLSGGQLVLAAAGCLAAAVTAGVPEAGVVSLALVLHMLGLPVEALSLLLAVDWVLGRARSVTNVLSDMVLAILVWSHEKREVHEAADALRSVPSR